MKGVTMRLKFIGLGGIGSLTLQFPLLTFLSYRYPDTTIYLYDHDRVEERNLERQHYHRIGGKAEVTKERLSRDFPKLRYRANDQRVTPANVFVTVKEYDIVFLSVDNHPTRKLVSRRCEELCNVLLISGGNEYHDGDVNIFWRKNGENMTLPLTNDFLPEIRDAQEMDIHGPACHELAATTQPQLVLTNNAVASTMLNVFYAYLQGKLNYDRVCIDIMTGNARAYHYTRDMRRVG